MFKKKITYVDFNEQERTEDFYFHMSVTDATKLTAKFNGVDPETHVKQLSLNQDMEAMVAFIEEIILSSYGKKSLDGKTFMKSTEIRAEFENSPAYAELFEEMLTNPEMALEFAKQTATSTKKALEESKKKSE